MCQVTLYKLQVSIGKSDVSSIRSKVSGSYKIVCAKNGLAKNTVIPLSKESMGNI